MSDYEIAPTKPLVSNMKFDLSFLKVFDDVVQKMDIPQILEEQVATLRFPVTLFLLLVQAEREACKAGRKPEESCMRWAANGRAIIIRNKEELINKLLPSTSFSKVKFVSFTRKLYRWGFRQVQGEARTKICNEGEIAFWHPHFQRDNKTLVVNMKSVPTKKTRRASVTQCVNGNQGSPRSELVSDQGSYRNAGGEAVATFNQTAEAPAVPVMSLPLLELAIRKQRLGLDLVEINQQLMSLATELVAFPISYGAELSRQSQATTTQALVMSGVRSPSTISGLYPLQPYGSCFASNPFGPTAAAPSDEIVRQAILQAICGPSRSYVPVSTQFPILEDVSTPFKWG